MEDVRVASFSLLKTFDPPIDKAHGKRVAGLSRLGKRIVVQLEDDLALVIHLMVAGRLHWHEDRPTIPKRYGLASFDFSTGSVLLTEASTKRRASLHVVETPEGLATSIPAESKSPTPQPKSSPPR